MAAQVQPPLPPTVHLETIYEESDHSFSSSVVNIHPHPSSIRQKFSSSHPTDGLVSARSIPSVDNHRRRRYRRIIADAKPPIEVRFRDGSKRYIHPSASSNSTNNSINRSGIQTKKKYRQVLSSMPSATKTKKSEIVLTIITAADLHQAGISPSFTSSPDESETVTITKSHSNSSLDTLHTMNDISFKESPEVPQQTSSSRSHSLPSAVGQPRPNINSMPPVAVVPPNSKRTMASLEITLANEENEKPSKFNRSEVPQKTLIVSNVHQTTRQTIPNPSNEINRGKILVGGSRSAFRPFHKQPTNNPTMTTTTRILPTNTVKPTVSTSIRFPLQTSTTLIHQPIQRDPRTISAERQSQMKLSDKSIPMPSQPQRNSSGEFLSDLIDSTLQWHSVTSKSLYDVPRLSHQFADIPLRITIPVTGPNQNQKLVHKHDPVLERRLFDAGLSPETIALYERVLEVADPQSHYSSGLLDRYSEH